MLAHLTDGCLADFVKHTDEMLRQEWKFLQHAINLAI